MTGMLLAAGLGERMEPLSSVIPKPALPVLHRPLLAAGLESLLRAGCQRVVVNLHRHPEQVAAAVRASALGKSTLFSLEPELLGPAGGIAAARPLLGQGPVLVANADTWAHIDLTPVLAAGDEGIVVLALLPHPNPRRWGAVHLDAHGRVQRISKPGTSQEGFLYTGFQWVGNRALSLLPLPPAGMKAFWQPLMKQGRLFGVIVQGQFFEAGDPESYWRLVMGLLGGANAVHPQASVHPQAQVASCAIGAGAQVGDGVYLHSCVLLPGAEVGAGAQLTRCVVMGCIPPGVTLRDSLFLGTKGAFTLFGTTNERAANFREKRSSGRGEEHQ